jgi:hypothetical protein
MKLLLPCAVILFSLVSCTEISDLTSKAFPTTDTKNLKIFSDAGINNDFPIPTDIVMIKNEDLIKVVAEMEASTWFEQKTYFLPSNAANLEVFQYEILPGSNTSAVKFGWSERRDAKAIFVISNFIQKVNGKVRVDQLKRPVLILTSNGIEVEEIKK